MYFSPQANVPFNSEGKGMESPMTFWEKAREKGLVCTFIYAAIGSVLVARETLRSTFDQFVEKGETSDDPRVRAVRDWLNRRNKKKTSSSW